MVTAHKQMVAEEDRCIPTHASARTPRRFGAPIHRRRTASPSESEVDFRLGRLRRGREPGVEGQGVVGDAQGQPGDPVGVSRGEGGGVIVRQVTGRGQVQGGPDDVAREADLGPRNVQRQSSARSGSPRASQTAQGAST